jgi:hypothetical protein
VQRPIDAERRAELLKIFGDGDGSFDARRDRKRVVAAVNVIVNMPEYQLN